jgi:hypothetical protein
VSGELRINQREIWITRGIGQMDEGLATFQQDIGARNSLDVHQDVVNQFFTRSTGHSRDMIDNGSRHIETYKL